ncbi:hypothetical protein SDC9_155931 [bioreactor metagenome]|uniref:Uncharacterized protein n=1 Tax=bioreactor metagenome TaxID=1076179 RepID=A0A645F4U0_9ZZZZ
MLSFCVYFLGFSSGFRYIVFTNRRLIRCLFYPEYKVGVLGNEPLNRSYLIVNRTGSNWSEAQKILVGPLSSTLSEYENKSVYVFETQLRRIIDVRKNKFDGMKWDGKSITSKLILGIKDMSKIVIFLWPEGHFEFCLYNPEDSLDVYNHLQQIISQNNK